MVLSLTEALSTVISFLLSSVGSILSYLKLLIDLPILFLTMLGTFPTFFTIGFTLILTMLVIVVFVKVKSYLL